MEITKLLPQTIKISQGESTKLLQISYTFRETLPSQVLVSVNTTIPDSMLLLDKPLQCKSLAPFPILLGQFTLGSILATILVINLGKDGQLFTQRKP
jgi:hypothetical protein